MSKQSELVGLARTTNLDEVNSAYSAGALSNRNLIINGAMQVAQRGTSFTGVTTDGYRLDRFKVNVNYGAYTITQAADGPSGFGSSYKIEVTTSGAPPAASINLVSQSIEGQNLQQLAKGTASAQSITVSFWVKSNKTGTYILEFDDDPNARNINAAYTVDVSGTWEYKTITFVGDTSGAIVSDNSIGARLIWWLGAGTNYTSGTLDTSWGATVNTNRAVGNVNLADTIGNTWQITGVQLEVGDTATPFEHRSYGQELALCQRYYRDLCTGVTNVSLTNATYYNTTSCYGIINLPVTMRATPTLATSSPAHFRVYSNQANAVPSSVSLTGSSDPQSLEIFMLTSARGAGDAAFFRTDSASASLQLDAEL